MFTGITMGTFPILAVEARGSGTDLVVGLSDELRAGLQIGASVAIDGVCLTVVSVSEQGVLFQAVAETLERTTLGSLQVGSLVSVERSARLGDELGGHEVAGHVKGTGVVAAVRASAGAHDLSITVPHDWMRFVFEKGFIAVDGSSLTVGRVHENGFDLHLIPETLRLTNLGKKRVGDRVNIELDARTVAVVETVERVLARRVSL